MTYQSHVCIYHQVIGDSNDETNFPHKLLLIDTQVLRLCKIFTNGFSTKHNIKILKTNLSKILQSKGFLCPLDIIMRPAINFALEVLGIMDSVEKGKNISKALLDAGYIIDNKTNIKNLAHYY